MKPKDAAGCVLAAISLFVTGPIWLYLLWTILKAINASEVAWLLYWVYVPLHLLGIVIAGIIRACDED